MVSPLRRLTAEDRSRAAAALDDLTDALDRAQVRLPSVAVDWRSANTTGVVLVDLGAARPDAIEALAAVIRRGSAR
ncbi:hypothetical protein [Kitasatospora sp. NPDC050543]|uniref:hypothetical protein n=1 Tax=Kitasatospora sp. NPDC050543 TaxID=3364054 RepID=UPI00378897E5